MKIKKVFTLILIFILIFFINTTFIYALTTSYTSIYDVGASTINITGIQWNNPSSISTTGDLSYMTFTNSDATIFINWTGSTFSPDEEKEGTYTLVYENVGVDSSGDSIDMYLTATVTGTQVSTSTYTMNSEKYYGVCELRTSLVRVGSIAWDIGMTSYTMALVNVDTQFDVTFTKHSSSEDATGQYLLYLYNIDVLRDSPRYSETIKLGDGFSSTVYLPEDSTLELIDDWFTPTCSSSETDDSRSCLTTLSDGNTFSFSHRSGGAMTKVFENFDIYSIVSNIYTSTDGGSTYSLDTTGGWVSATNTTTSDSEYSVLSQITSTSETITAYWKNNYEYETTANTGYHLAQITYDDETLTSTSSYTFEEVTSDHTFNVYYVANSYNVLFDGNGATSGSTDDMEDLYYDTTYTLNENGFVRTGYTFVGWNTEADGSGTSFEDEEEFSNLTYEDGGTVTLYAQWEAIPCNIYVYYIDYNTGETLDNYSYTGIYGEDVTTSSKDFDGYTLVKSPDTEDYTLDLDDIYVYYYYSKNSDVIVYYLDYYTNEEIASSETIEGYEGLSYTTEQKEISNYEFVTSTSNTSGIMEDETIYVYYYYEELVSLEFVKVNYDNEPLEGVKFSLFKLICTNSEHDHTSDLIDVENYDTSCWELVGTFSSDENGIIYLDNLYISGVYRLVETKTLTGYTLPTGQLQIEFNYNDNLSEEDIVTLGGLEFSITAVGNSPKVSIASDTLYLYNKLMYSVATTGNIGIYIYLISGLIIITLGVGIKLFR